MQKKVTGWYLFVLNAFTVGLSFMWNSLHVTILPAVLLSLGGLEFKNTRLGLLKFAGLFIAMIVQPLAGALSDHWSSKIGRRRPLILLGTMGNLAFLAVMAFVGGLPALCIAYVGLQITANITQGPAQGLMPDEVPAEQLGMGSGIKTAMEISGSIFSALLMGKLISSSKPDPTLAVLAIMAFVALFSVITLGFSHEKPTLRPERKTIDWKKLWKDVFNFDVRRNHKSYWQLILCRFLFLLGVFGFQTFAYNFIYDRFPGLDTVKTTNMVIGCFVVILVFSSLAAGALGDKFGTQRIHFIAGFIGAAGAVLMVFARDMTHLVMLGSVMGIGVGMFMSTNWALANKSAPPAEAGKYMGLTNLATAGSSAIVGLMGPAIDAVNNARTGAFLGYTMLFLFAAVLMLASSAVVKKIEEPGKEIVVSE